jgi:hypothetical protein
VIDAARAAFRRAVARARAIEVKPPAYDDVVAWRAHGRTTCEEARRVAFAGLDDVVGPCLTALLGDRAASAPREATA